MSELNYEFELYGPVDAGLMNKAIKQCPRPAFSKSISLGTIVMPLLEGAFHAAGGIVFVFLVLQKMNFSPQVVGISASLLGCFLAIAVMKLTSHVKRTWQVKQMLKSPIYKDDTMFFLSPEKFTLRTENVEWNVRWPAVEKTVNASDGFFFYAGAFTYVLPKSILSADQADEVWSAIESWSGKKSL